MGIFESEDSAVLFANCRFDVLGMSGAIRHFGAPMVKSELSDKQPTSRRQSVLADFSFGEALKAALAGRKMVWLSDKTGIPTSTLSDYARGKVPGVDNVLLIATALKMSLDQLVGGRGQAVAETLGLTMIPEIDISYSMGGGSVVDDYVDAKLVPFRADWLTRLTHGGSADVFLTRGQGDSMMPTLLDDDDVLVNRADRTIRQQDRIWALGYGDLGMIKRVRRLPSGLFQLNSDNSAVSSIEATEEEMYIVGRVIWIGRRV